MSLLAEVSKTVVNATLAFTAASSSLVSTGSGAKATPPQPYTQTGNTISIPDTVQSSYLLGAFDTNTTTFVYPVVLASGAAEVQVYANGAAAGAPPNFSLAATLPVAGSAGTGLYAQTQLSSNGLVCVYGSGSDNGGAAVFTRPSISSQAWTQVATVNGPPGDNLGDSVDISADGTVISISAWQSNGGVGSTNIYSFNAAMGTLTLVKTLVGTGAVGASNQGYYNALSGDGMTLAVGGPSDNANYGAVWMFKNVNGTWSQMGSKLVPYNASPAAFFGADVALSYDGTRLAVAATSNTLARNSGSVFMYDLVDGASWVQGQTIYPLLSTATTFESIAKIALSDDGTILVFDEENLNSNKGAAFVYNLQANGLWVQNGEARVPSGALFQNSNAFIHLSGMSPTGSMFALTDLFSTAPTDPLAVAVFQ